MLPAKVSQRPGVTSSPHVPGRHALESKSVATAVAHSGQNDEPAKRTPAAKKLACATGEGHL